jgi:hypothetical protein
VLVILKDGFGNDLREKIEESVFIDLSWQAEVGGVVVWFGGFHVLIG